MGMSLSKLLQKWAFGKSFTPQGDRIVTTREHVTEDNGKKYIRKKTIVRETGEKVYEAHFVPGDKKPFIEWFGPNYAQYMLLNS